MRIGVIMDPIESVLVDRDTSFALMLAAQTRGHEAGARTSSHPSTR
jgi:glutathione synthase